jgi:hypothetical protein
VLSCLAKSAKKKVGTDIREIIPLKVIHKVQVPAFFMVARKDLLSRPWRVKALYDSCGSADKCFFLVEGDHCSQRDSLTMRKAANFIFKRFTLENFRADPDRMMQESESVLTEEDCSLRV